tara:strand:- start:340 stop:951 length:612 start_codon:yes stop_codon:yes gene_type:complete
MFKEIKRNHLISEMQIESDERSGTVETWFPNWYPDKTDELNDYMKSVCENDDRLARNYKDLNYYNFPFITTVKRDGKIIECGTGYTSMVYPKNCLRVMNRYYRATMSRPTVTTEYARPSKLAVIEQQLEMARRLDFEVAIITRDRARRHFVKFADALTAKSDQVWEVSDKKYLVTPNEKNPLAWQYIAYTKLTHIGYDFWSKW